MIKIFLTALSILTLESVCLAQNNSNLVLKKDPAAGVQYTIQILQDKDNIIFQLGSNIPRQIVSGSDLDFGHHVPYPITQYIFAIPLSNCVDGLHCDSHGLIPMSEVHATGQEVPRVAAIRFAIDPSGVDSKKITVLLSDDKGSVAEISDVFSVVQ